MWRLVMNSNRGVMVNYEGKIRPPCGRYKKIRASGFPFSWEFGPYPEQYCGYHHMDLNAPFRRESPLEGALGLYPNRKWLPRNTVFQVRGRRLRKKAALGELQTIGKAPSESGNLRNSRPIYTLSGPIWTKTRPAVQRFGRLRLQPMKKGWRWLWSEQESTTGQSRI